ncbi:MAG: CDP-alcohol phosphatidyltransferase family protein [Galactobacter sp.]|uniref:CDP-alcohol phosphatidyltransferase family protein n=1 Tax=Galactobacter sp. TaxID=2676125 RepID=UPI0025C6A605|nr:CDP-alcohol phosphatidyltransferase family protein [Galactobacter sp.]
MKAPARSPSFRDNLRSLDGAQKSGAGVPAYMRWVNRRAGRVIAAGAGRMGLTPNMVTGISALLSGLGLVLVIVFEPHVWTGVLAALLLAAGFAFDSADGQLARLTGAGGPAGEWLDHVVDAIRTPTVHLCVAAAMLLYREDLRWAVIVAACFAVLSVGQFMSQILAEQLAKQRGARAEEGNGKLKSWILLPNDTGTLCWMFVLWGAPAVFCVGYALLFALNLLHAAVSMRRKFRLLRTLG